VAQTIGITSVEVFADKIFSIGKRGEFLTVIVNN
jgi:hypothetical protein